VVGFPPGSLSTGGIERTRLPAKRARRDIEGALYARRKALADLMRSPALGQGDIDAAVQQITETAADVLDVERASVWDLVEDGTAIVCRDLYERSQQRHSAGARIAAADVPRYFAALERERAIKAHNARFDLRTSEFSAGYLEPLGITAMLDAPVFLRGKMVGVVCHEHTGSPRRWQMSEELLASTFADFVALVLETAAWRQAEDALRIERDALEGKVAERTRELQTSEANLRALVDFSPAAMVVTRLASNTVMLANRRATAMFEVPLDEVQGQRTPDFWVNIGDRSRYLAILNAQGRVEELETQLRTRSGRVFWARLSAQRLRLGGEETLLATILDVTTQRETQDDLRLQATHDPLTGVFNRRQLEEVARKEVDRAHRHRRPLAVAMLDADHFKRVNDSYGHHAGDEVLRTIAKRCQGTLRTNDVLGRYGGEEFVVLFPETTLSDAGVVAERLRAAIADQPFDVGDRGLSVTVSLGVAALSDGLDLQRLLQKADAALYVAKQAGRNLVRTG
jgi:diguanylate cyclase (GGDEF)-like protein/PAS domain S-box-containing protein